MIGRLYFRRIQSGQYVGGAYVVVRSNSHCWEVSQDRAGHGACATDRFVGYRHTLYAAKRLAERDDRARQRARRRAA